MFIFLHYFHFKYQLPKMYLICTINLDFQVLTMLFNETHVKGNIAQNHNDRKGLCMESVAVTFTSRPKKW